MPHRNSCTSVSNRPPYILKNGKAVPEWDSGIVNSFIEDASNRRIDETFLRATNGTEIHVSTVFLCIDHNYSRKGEPVLWETMIFWPGNDELDNWCQRYSSEKDARAGHNKAVASVTSAIQLSK